MAVDWEKLFGFASRGFLELARQQDENKVSNFATQQAQQPGLTREQYMANVGQLPARLRSGALGMGRMFPSSTDAQNAAVANRRMDLRERQMTLAEKQFAAKGGTGNVRKRDEDINVIARQLGDFEGSEISQKAPGAADRETLRQFTMDELGNRFSLTGENAKAVAEQLRQYGYDPGEKDAYNRTLTERALMTARNRAANKLINPNDPVQALGAAMVSMQRVNNEERKAHDRMIAGIKDQADVNESTTGLASTVAGASKIQQLYDLSTGTKGNADTINALAEKYFDPNEMYPERRALEQYEKYGKVMADNLNKLTSKSKILVERNFPDTKKKFSPEEDLGEPARAALASVFPYIQYRLGRTQKGSMEQYSGRRKELETKGANEYVAHSAAGSALGMANKSFSDEVTKVVKDIFPGLDKDMQDLMVKYTFAAMGSK